MYDPSKISELIAFSRAGAGSTVVDVFPGDGDWTRRFSEVVGAQGRVYSFVPSEFLEIKADAVAAMEALAHEPGRDNVRAVTADVVGIAEATGSADVVWVHLFYHDLHTALIQAKGATAARFNQAVHETLKPGGRYVIVDHAARAGSGTDDTQALHRIDPAAVRREVEAAGFRLEDESDLVANDADSHALKVFDAKIKGRTDRLAYRFVRL